MIDITHFSDIHQEMFSSEMEGALPGGDVLIFTGDAGRAGNLRELARFSEWFDELPYSRKMWVPGNHDVWIEEVFAEGLDPVSELRKVCRGDCNFKILIDESVEIDGLKFYGTPWQPRFFDWAFNLSEEELIPFWDKIPDDVDVLMTHTPSLSVLDKNIKGNECGSYTLADRIKDLSSLKVHLFGHIHESYGYADKGYAAINASALAVPEKKGKTINPPVRFELDESGIKFK